MTLDQPDIRYCMTDDGVRLAYCVFGEGPPLVRAAGFPSHIAHAFQMRGAREGTLRLAREFTLVQYDPRGMGLSQRILDFSIDTRVADLRAVVQHLGIPQFAISGLMHATPLAMAYAARYPLEVTKLFLVGAYASGPKLYETSKAFAAYAALESVTVDQWDFVTTTIASRSTGYQDPERAAAMADMIRAAITAEGYVAYRRDNRLTDVTAELASIKAPTFVVATGHAESVVPAELSQEVAAPIPNARFHLDVTPEAGSGVPTDALNDIMADFLRAPGAARPEAAATPAPPAAPAPGGLRTVLFTDIVGHTDMMQRLGDERGRDVLREQERITRELLREYAGAEVKTMGDGFLASFGSVTKALDCAIALQRAFAAREGEPLQVRVGLNAGEPIEEDGDLFGSTVILAARIAAKAGAGEILIPEPLRHLLSGKSYTYTDRGASDLKGFDDAVRLYEVRWQP